MTDPQAVTVLPSRPAPTGSSPLARLVRIEDWKSVVGGEVYVARCGTVVRIGVLELATDDESVGWLAASGADSRIMISKRDDHEVWIAPRQLQPGRPGGWQ